MKKTLLYFVKPCKPYNTGETAGFNARDAMRIKAMGVAVETDRPNMPPSEDYAPESSKWRSPPEKEDPPKKPVKRSRKKK